LTDKQIKLLVVDDHHIFRVGLQMALQQVPDFVLVGEAFDGAMALTKVQECDPDVVLIDIRMPILNGIEATRQIKSLYPQKRVLIFTSNDSTADVFAALSAGADGYITKDSTVDDLSLAIHSVAAGACWLDPQIAKMVLKSSVVKNADEISTSGTLSTSGANKQASDSNFNHNNNSYCLSRREYDVLDLLVQGNGNIEIAQKLSLSVETVKTHMTHIMSKLAVSDRTQAAVKALRENIIS
jgi:DNA-binding NarL/FixJ family response regulator